MRRFVYFGGLVALSLRLGQAAPCPVASLQYYLNTFTGLGSANSCTLDNGAIVFGDFTTGPTGIQSSGQDLNPWSPLNSPQTNNAEYTTVNVTPFGPITVNGSTAWGFTYTTANGGGIVIGDPGNHSDLNVDFDATYGNSGPVIQGVYTEMTGQVCDHNVGPCGVTGNNWADDKFVEDFKVNGVQEPENMLFIEPDTPTSTTCPSGPTGACSVSAVNTFALTNEVVHTDTDVDARGIGSDCPSMACSNDFAFLTEAKQGVFTDIAPPTSTPEPSTFALAGGFLALVLAKARRRRSA